MPQDVLDEFTYGGRVKLIGLYFDEDNVKSKDKKAETMMKEREMVKLSLYKYFLIWIPMNPYNTWMASFFLSIRSVYRLVYYYFIKSPKI